MSYMLMTSEYPQIKKGYPSKVKFRQNQYEKRHLTEEQHCKNEVMCFRWQSLAFVQFLTFC